MRFLQPSYLELHESGELLSRAQRLRAMLSACTLCAQECGVNRTKGEIGFCHASDALMISSCGPHHGEETELSGRFGSGTIFLTNCNSKCIFCQNYDISQLHRGTTITVEDLADHYMQLQSMGCHNVNFVTPAHYLPHIVEALILAIERGFSLPLVYNSNGYDSVQVLELLEGVFDIYLPDMKYGNSRIASRLSRLYHYVEKAKKAIREMHRQTGLLKTDRYGIAISGVIIRHLVLPNNLARTDKVMKIIAGIDPRIRVNLMGQYHPAYRAADDAQLNRRLYVEEYRQAYEDALDAGLTDVVAQECSLPDQGVM